MKIHSVSDENLLIGFHGKALIENTLVVESLRLLQTGSGWFWLVLFNTGSFLVGFCVYYKNFKFNFKLGLT